MTVLSPACMNPLSAIAACECCRRGMPAFASAVVNHLIARKSILGNCCLLLIIVVLGFMHFILMPSGHSYYVMLRAPPNRTMNTLIADLVS